MDDSRRTQLLATVATLTATLQHKKLCIATAESCTGGLLAGFLTHMAGSSAWFERGFVTYSNLAKEDMLGVDKKLIVTEGAVSLPVAKAMALGAIEHSAADITVAVTGIAGPGGGSVDKPVGMVCFAWASRSQKLASECCYFGALDRETIRLTACQQAFQGMLTFLTNSC